MNYFVNRCRLCNAEHLKLVIKLNDSPVADAYVRKTIKQKIYPLELYFCTLCGNVQIGEVLPDSYFVDATNSSGNSKIRLTKSFSSYAEEIRKTIRKGSKVLDIGSDKSTLSKELSDTFVYYGVQKSDSLTNNYNSYPREFSARDGLLISKERGKFDCILINNTLANIDNLSSAIKGCQHCLNEDGLIIMESSYLLSMINNMIFDFIYHEHLSYFSILPLVAFFKRFGMRLIRLQEVMTKGGSLRYYWASEASKWEGDASVARLTERERQADIGIKTFATFQKKINLIKKQVTDCLAQHIGKKIVGYGASATSTTLISHFGLHKYLSYLVDDNPGKIGTCSPGYRIPVYGPEKLREEQPDIILILAWRFKDEILKKISNLSSMILTVCPMLRSEVPPIRSEKCY